MELRKNGPIILEKNRCTIPDLSRLEEAAMFDPTYLHLTRERKAGNGPLAGDRTSVAPIGSIRRECLDHVIVFGERHLRQLLRSYQQYYNGSRTHLALAKDSPLTRSVQRIGSILPLPILGGLHHRYVRI